MASTNTKEAVMDIKIKDIIDLSYFWAQMGTASHFDEFEKQMVQLSEWCEGSTCGCYKDSSSLHVDLIAAVRDNSNKENGRWIRGKVTRIVSESSVEMFMVDLGHTAVVGVAQICAGFPPIIMKIPQQALQCVLAGVEQIKVDEEGIGGWPAEAVEVFCSLVTAPIKAIVRKVLDRKQILISIFTPFEGKFTSVGEILKKKQLVEYKPTWLTTLDIPVPREVAVLDNHQFSSKPVEDAVPSSLPIAPLLSQTYLESVEDQEPSISLDNSLVFGDDDDEDGSVSISVVEVEEEGRVNQDVSKQERMPVIDMPPLSSFGLVLSESNEHPKTPEDSPTSEHHQARPLLSGGSALSPRSDKMVVAAVVAHEAKNNAPRDHMSSFLKEEIARITSRTRTKQEKEFLEDVLGGGDESSGSLSDSDWKDESLLPLGSVGAVERGMKSSNVKTESIHVALPNTQSFSASILTESKNNIQVSSGNPGRRSNSGATGEHSSGKFQGYTSKHCRDDGNFGTDKWTRGRGGSLFKDGSLNRRKKDYSGGRQFDRDKSWGGKKGRGRGQQLHGSRRQLEFPVCPPATEHSKLVKGLENLPLPQYTSSYSESPRSTGGLVEVTAGGLVQVAASETSTRTSSEVYSSKVEQMTKVEIDGEAKWQVWKFEKEIGKVVNCLDAGTVGNFAGEVDKLLKGATAQKMSELPGCTPPLEVVVVFVVREAVLGALNVHLVVRAIHMLLEGSCGDGVCVVIEKVMGNIAADVLECGVDEGKKTCCGLSQFVGLLLNGLTARKFGHIDAIVTAIKKVFRTWASFLGPTTPEQAQKTQVFSYGFLLDTVSNSLELFKDELSDLLNGPIKSSILYSGYSEALRGSWLENAYRTLQCVHPSTHEDTNPAVDVPLLVTDGNCAKAVNSERSSAVGETVAQNAAEKELSQHTRHKMPSKQPLMHGTVPLEDHTDIALPCQSHAPLPLPLPRPGMQHSPSLPEKFTFPSRPFSPPGAKSHYINMPSNSSREPQGSHNLYTRVTSMLDALQLGDILPLFKSSFIKDSVLDCQLDDVKTCLKDAKVPPGAILEINKYLQNSKKCSRKQASGIPSNQRPVSQQELQQQEPNLPHTSNPPIKQIHSSAVPLHPSSLSGDQPAIQQQQQITLAEQQGVEHHSRTRSHASSNGYLSSSQPLPHQWQNSSSYQVEETASSQPHPQQRQISPTEHQPPSQHAQLPAYLPSRSSKPLLQQPHPQQQQKQVYPAEHLVVAPPVHGCYPSSFRAQDSQPQVMMVSPAQGHDVHSLPQLNQPQLQLSVQQSIPPHPQPLQHTQLQQPPMQQQQHSQPSPWQISQQEQLCRPNSAHSGGFVVDEGSVLTSTNQFESAGGSCVHRQTVTGSKPFAATARENGGGGGMNVGLYGQRRHPAISSNHSPPYSTPSPTPSSPLPAERKPVGGFGVINCVICGGKDHASYNCRQRDKRFIHM